MIDSIKKNSVYKTIYSTLFFASFFCWSKSGAEGCLHKGEMDGGISFKVPV